MIRICKCSETIILKGETGTPENYYYGKCSKCNRGLTIWVNVKTNKEREHWSEPNQTK